MRLSGLLRSLLTLALGLTLMSGAAPAGAAEPPLKKVLRASATRIISPLEINFIVPMVLDYYKQEGLEVELLPLGSNAAVLAALQSKRITFGTGVPSFQLPMLAKGGEQPMINYFEHTYPFKYGLAVNPNSTLTGFQDFKGKKIGVSNFGGSEYEVGKAITKMVGLDPEKDVTWIAVGENITAGEAMRRNEIDGLFYYDSAFGAIEAAGIPIKYLPMPKNVPMVGGVYTMALKETLTNDRKTAVGMARAVFKASVFIETNPEAAAFLFLKAFPEAGAKGKPIEEQVRLVQFQINKRFPLYTNPDKSVTKRGFINANEWVEEVKFSGLTGKVNPTLLYTNDLINEANNFDVEKIRQEARNFKLPYKK